MNDAADREHCDNQLAARLLIRDIDANLRRVLLPGAEGDDEEEQIHKSSTFTCQIAVDVLDPTTIGWEPLLELFPVEIHSDQQGSKETAVEIKSESMFLAR